ncbi:hypothetical protein N9161_02290 [Porticoccaceae bacterium]|nr:hypothetical protein [Porticoccaceae bacterium]
MQNLPLTALIFCSLFLSSCSDQKPDGHVYTVNGLGLTLPSPDLEMVFLPYNSRAEFFHGPITEAYEYSTLGLDQALLPLCDDANAIIAEELASLAQSRNELQQRGNVPETPDACMNMCSSRISLEDQRETERKTLNQKIAGIDQKISSAKQKKKQLQSARSKKAGALSQQLANLKKKRSQLLGQEAKKLAKKQIAGLTIELGASRLSYPSLHSGKRVTIDLRNNSQFAIKGRPSVVLEGYYQGIKIGDYSVKLGGSNKTDSLGFDKNYSIGVGELGRLEQSIYYSVTGLSLNTPTGRLLAQERGWKPNSKGYILPDEVRILSFPSTAFVIPDETGKRQDSSIFYSPKRVYFEEQVAARGLPQDNEIAKISKQINNQSFPEDDKIAALENDISELRADQKSSKDAFNSSQVAKNINSLIESESQCRAANTAMNEIDDYAERIAKWKDNLSSCGTEDVDTGAIFSGLNAMNYLYGDVLELPEITEKYVTKARHLIWAKLASESQYVTKTDINGDFNIDGAIDQSNSLVFAPMMSMSGESFWMQPLSSLNGKKNLNHQLLGRGDFSEYISYVISDTCNNCSLEEFSSIMVELELAAPNPNQLANNLSNSEKVYAEQLANLEASDYDRNISEESPVQAAPSQACEI